MPKPTINHARIASLIWGIADAVLRDLYVRGKYRDVILPFTGLRRLDSSLGPTRDVVTAMKKIPDDAGTADQGVRDERARPLIRIVLPSAATPDPLHGRYESVLDARTTLASMSQLPSCATPKMYR